MKLIMTRISCFFCAIFLLSTLVISGASEVPTTEAKATLWKGNVILNGERMAFINEDGQSATLFYYNGTVYIPLQTAGDWMGCSVNWNKNSYIVELTSGGAPSIYNSDFTNESGADIDEVNIQICPDISVTLDGNKQVFANAKGEVVYPVLYQETVYLPIRSIGELCDLEVVWVQAVPVARSNIHLYTPLTDKQKEEIRTFVTEGFRLCNKFEPTLNAILTDRELGNEPSVEQLNEVQVCLEEFYRIPQPSAPCAEYFTRKLQVNIDYMTAYFTDIAEQGEEKSQYMFATFVASLERIFKELQSVTPGLW